MTGFTPLMNWNGLFHLSSLCMWDSKINLATLAVNPRLSTYCTLNLNPIYAHIVMHPWLSCIWNKLSIFLNSLFRLSWSSNLQLCSQRTPVYSWTNNWGEYLILLFSLITTRGLWTQMNNEFNSVLFINRH